MCKQQQLPKIQANAIVEANAAIVSWKSCGVDRSCPTSVTSALSQDVRLDQYQDGSVRGSSTKSVSSIGSDHEFEWYDLDAIREVDKNANSSQHDAKAGLVFTTELLDLTQGVQVNVTSTKTNNNKIELDLYFWKVGETREDREFRERMQALEQEIQQ